MGAGALTGAFFMSAPSADDESNHVNDRQKLARGITRAVLLSGQPEHEIALKIGVNSNSLYRWKRGESRPNPVNLLRLADCLGVEAEDLRDGLPHLDKANPTTNYAHQEIM